MERPSDLLARAQVWSNYIHYTTVNVLIGITLQGTISLCAKHMEEEIVEQSNLIDCLEPDM